MKLKANIKNDPALNRYYSLIKPLSYKKIQETILHTSSIDNNDIKMLFVLKELFNVDMEYLSKILPLSKSEIYIKIKNLIINTDINYMNVNMDRTDQLTNDVNQYIELFNKLYYQVFFSSDIVVG